MLHVYKWLVIFVASNISVSLSVVCMMDAVKGLLCMLHKIVRNVRMTDANANI